MAASAAIRDLTCAIALLAALLAPFGLACCAPHTDYRGSGSTDPASDVVGGGGRLDQTYREIYHPGSGTGW